MRLAHRLRVPALATAVAFALLMSSLPASAAGPKRIFITKYNEKFVGQAGVTFELYQDTDGDGVRDEGEPLLQTKVTDAAGKATFDPVNPGKYVVHEVTPAGYTDNPDKDVEIPNAKGPGPSIVFSNTPKPANHRVNDPTGEKSIEDGTHISDFGPAIAALCEDDGTGEPCRVLAAWNDSAGFHTSGGPSAVAAALSTDTGGIWGPQAKMLTGSFAALLGQPAVAVDLTRHRFFIASTGFKIAGAFDRYPIGVSTFGTGFTQPVDTFPGITPGWVAHDPSIAVDQGGPRGGDAYLVYTLSLAEDESEIAFSVSTDGGQTWVGPSSISGLGTFDHGDVNVGPNSAIYAAWADYQGSANSYDILFARSTNGGETFGEPTFIRVNTPKPGTPGQCTGSSVRTVLGSVAVSGEADLAVDPGDVTRLFTVYPVHGQGNDESNVVYATSHDGGQTWDAEPFGSAVGTQWGPHIDVTPDGRVAMTYWQSLDGSTVDAMVAYYNPFEDAFIGEPRSLTNGHPFPLWNLDPSFDTDINGCFGLGDPATFAPGSGFLFAWADGRDAGPVGNGGVDPNIYFAHDVGPFLDTTLSMSVSRTSSEIQAGGHLSPRPLGARVTVTLFRDDGDGFDRLGRKRVRVDPDGTYSASFDRPSGGACRITVAFGGSEGRSPSVPRSKTFAC